MTNICKCNESRINDYLSVKIDHVRIFTMHLLKVLTVDKNCMKLHNSKSRAKLRLSYPKALALGVHSTTPVLGICAFSPH